MFCNLFALENNIINFPCSVPKLIFHNIIFFIVWKMMERGPCIILVFIRISLFEVLCNENIFSVIGFYKILKWILWKGNPVGTAVITDMSP